ncbi:RcnB family protein [Thermomonas alba]|uniref:RcnB family protein n=1 Tax=Thermomonas alba TaxID=2888525 RepID=UPI001F0419D8|nr:RcnB family protein [Thermomonas alba]
MKRSLIALVSAPLLLALLSGPAAAFGGHDHDRDDRGEKHEHHAHDRGWHHGPPRRVEVIHEREVIYRPAPPRVVYRPVPPPRWVRGGYYYGPGYGPTYVVEDWRYYQLPPPPRGYYWRRSDAGDFLLVAAATGIIADLILHH